MLMHFPILMVVLYAFSALLVISALMVIFSRHPVQSALYLVLAFFAGAGLWIISKAEFLGLILILVYVGAVMTLFLFVVMTVPFHTTPQVGRYRFVYVAIALIVITLFVAMMFKVFSPFSHIIYHFADNPLPGVGGAHAIGMHLYTDYVFPFEIAGLILLVAIIAAISLSLKIQRHRIVTHSAEQIAVTAESRLKIIKMPSEKKRDKSNDTEAP